MINLGFEDTYYFPYIPIFFLPKFPAPVFLVGFDVEFPLPTLKNFKLAWPPYEICLTISYIFI